MRIFYLITAFCFSAFTTIAQGTSGFSGTGANVDVDNYQIYWRINPDSLKGIKGIVKIKFKTTVANVSTVSFDLGNSMVIDKLERGANVLSTPTISGNKFTAALGTTLAAIGTRDSVTVTYHGVPPSVSAFGGAIGFQKTTDPARNAAYVSTNSLPAYRETTGAGNTTYTLAESYEDRDWWPCKADMQDKADTIDISVNVPWLKTSATDTFWVATNGTLVDSVINAGDKSRTFTFINRYPMATYLVGLSIARYNRYYRGSVNIGGFNVPVVYYLFAGKTDYTPILNAMDKVTELLQQFSLKFGDYGFLDKLRGGKHGFYEGLGTFGGMEHQTFSAISTNSLTNLPLLAHELSHQWFGDKISFGKWNDLWLAEGFAKYSESLGPELVSGMGYTAFSERSTIKSNALAEAASTFIPDTYIVNSDSIWASKAAGTAYSNSVYVRGAMVVSMLRTLAGDTKFFNILKEYQTRASLQFKSATTDTLSKIFSDSLGVDLTQFFIDNVKGTGYPKNDVYYTQYHGNYDSIYLKVKTQTTGKPSSASFQQPIVVHLKKTTVPIRDTTIVFFDWRGLVSKAGSGSFGPKLDSVGYRLLFRPDTYLVDDSAQTLSSLNTITGIDALATNVLDLRIIDFTVKPFEGYNAAVLLLDDNSINSDIILERSANGINFENIAVMLLQASTSLSKKYLFNDVQPLETNNYYRVKYKNTAGIYLFSKIIKIRSVKMSSFSIISNPVKDVLQIRTADAQGKDLTVTIYDETGKLVKGSVIYKAPSISEVSVAGLHAGVYILKITIVNGTPQNLNFLIN